MSNELMELEKRLTDAERCGDREALSLLLSEDFEGVNSHGKRVGKEAFIRGLCDSGLRFDQLEIADLSIRMIGPIGIVMGQSAFRVNVGSRVIEASAQYMNCWQLQGDTWRLVASSITPEA
ncbi:MAG: nuclear transport factor 2 family protein [Opitutales bacterium]|nr:nuclear transport factor 2 family protein [Opitutales bacterium]